MGVVDGGLVNEQSVVDFEGNVNETDVGIPHEERAIIDQSKNIIAEGVGNNHGMSFKKVDKKRSEEETRKVNIKHVVTKEITKTNNLIKAASVWVARQLGLKKGQRDEEK